jgi:hypothetical protein
MLNKIIDDIICLCTNIDLGWGVDENQAQRWDSAWLAAGMVQGRIASISGVMAAGDLLDHDGLPRGAHEPSVRGPKHHIVPMSRSTCGAPSPIVIIKMGVAARTISRRGTPMHRRWRSMLRCLCQPTWCDVSRNTWQIAIKILYNNIGFNRLLSMGPPCFATHVLFSGG